MTVFGLHLYICTKCCCGSGHWWLELLGQTIVRAVARVIVQDGRHVK